MGPTRKRHSKEFKAKGCAGALKGTQTLSELALRYKVHPTQIAQWKRQLQAEAPAVFERGRARQEVDAEAPTATLYQEIGRLKLEVDFLKKKRAEGACERTADLGGFQPTHTCQFRGSAPCSTLPAQVCITRRAAANRRKASNA